MPGIFPFTVRWSWKSPRKIGNVMGSHSLAAQIQNLPGLSDLGTFVHTKHRMAPVVATQGPNHREVQDEPHTAPIPTGRRIVWCANPFQIGAAYSTILHHTPPHLPQDNSGSQGSQVLPHLSCKVKSSSSNDATIQAPKLKLLEQPVGIISRGLQIHKGWVPWHEELQATLVSKIWMS
jgi:hypothetical protein